jgi:hypothetical protein
MVPILNTEILQDLANPSLSLYAPVVGCYTYHTEIRYGWYMGLGNVMTDQPDT